MSEVDLFEGSCPHCQRGDATSERTPGTIVDCAHCDRSFVIPAVASSAGVEVASGAEQASVPIALAPTSLPQAATTAPAHASGPRDVPLGSTGLIAAGLTLVFYLGLVGPLGDTYFGELFGARGWVPYVISFLSFWSGVMLVAKYRRLSLQMRVLELDLLPHAIAGELTPETAPRFVRYLGGLPTEFRENFLVQRVCAALEHFGARASVRETVDQLRSLAERDEGVVESSFTMLRVFIWAIPILGFIGTVLGIGASVGGFSESVSAAANLEVMKDSIGTVTSGLGVAFDTTLLALVMSIFIMFPTSSLQKAEEDYLTSVDEYCRRHLIARLDDTEATNGNGAAGVAEVAGRLADALVEALGRRLPEAR
jgi:biopolymer transport protein ExbB/TolQ